MPLGNQNVNRPGQQDGAGSALALHIQQYTGIVEGVLNRESQIKPYVNMRSARGTSTLQNYAVGKSVIQKFTPGVVADGTVSKFGRTTVVIDTLLGCRENIDVLDNLQIPFDAKKEVGESQGKEISRFYDQAFLIQGCKAAQLTTNRYGLTGTSGHPGGTQVTMAAAADRTDPAKLFARVADLFAGMEAKDVNPRRDGVMLVLRPAEFYTLQQNDQIIDGSYKTSDGVNITAQILRAYGVPIISSNDLPNSVVTGHPLSNAANSNAYDGDFSKVVGLAMSTRCLLAGETIPLTTDIFYDRLTKSWFADAHMAFGVAPSRADMAGLIVTP